MSIKKIVCYNQSAGHIKHVARKFSWAVLLRKSGPFDTISSEAVEDL